MAEQPRSETGWKQSGEWTESIARCKPIPPGTPRGGRMYTPSVEEMERLLITLPLPRHDDPDARGPVAPTS
jgi:hypothetical protein